MAPRGRRATGADGMGGAARARVRARWRAHAPRAAQPPRAARGAAAVPSRRRTAPATATCCTRRAAWSQATGSSSTCRCGAGARAADHAGRDQALPARRGRRGIARAAALLRGRRRAARVAAAGDHRLRGRASRGSRRGSSSRQGAEFVGCEVLCLGRPVRGERFDARRASSSGSRSTARAAAAGRARALRGGSAGALRAATACTARRSWAASSASAAASAGAAAPSCARRWRRLPAPGETAASELAFALVCRYRGAAVEDAQRALRAAWACLRRECFGSDAVAPRIWAT